MTSTRPPLIVVGVDGTTTGDTALLFAVDEAARTGDPIMVVTAWLLEPPPASPFGMVWDGSSPEDQRLAAATVQSTAIARVMGDAGGVAPATQIIQGEAGRALVRASADARMLVVGSRSLGPARAALLGSVSRYCAHHATCPVVVVPAAAHLDDTATAALREPALTG